MSECTCCKQHPPRVDAPIDFKKIHAALLDGVGARLKVHDTKLKTGSTFDRRLERNLQHLDCSDDVSERLHAYLDGSIPGAAVFAKPPNQNQRDRTVWQRLSKLFRDSARNVVVHEPKPAVAHPAPSGESSDPA